MVLTVADVERWNAGAVRDVFHAATARGNATLEASRQLSTLAVPDSWDGLTAEARKHANASIRQDLDAHGQESLTVAQAAGNAADDIEKVQSELRTLQHDASELHMTIDPVAVVRQRNRADVLCVQPGMDEIEREAIRTEGLDPDDPAADGGQRATVLGGVAVRHSTGSASRDG